MTTGTLVDWLAMVGRPVGAPASSDTAPDSSTSGTVTLPALEAIWLATADEDCKDEFREPQTFLLWPDAKRGFLVAQPTNLPHVLAYCANEIDLNMDQARKFGFSESLLTAIARAHRLSASKPKQ
jgi:hypothetical protein